MLDRPVSTEMNEVRPDFVPKKPYFSSEWAAKEADRLWPRVWQMVCRDEEIPKVGDYLTYEICDESFIIVRTDQDTVKAFYNVCPHRGRRIMDGCGNAKVFMCPFHGWTWRSDGSLLRALDHKDWDGCPEMSSDDLALDEVLVDRWGGFVFINQDLNAQPLREFLDPAPSYLDCIEFDKMRFRWYKSLRIPCNWKTALEAFNEAYHVSATHSQFLVNMGDDVTRSFTHGRHGMFGLGVGQLTDSQAEHRHGVVVVESNGRNGRAGHVTCLVSVGPAQTSPAGVNGILIRGSRAPVSRCQIRSVPVSTHNPDPRPAATLVGGARRS